MIEAPALAVDLVKARLAAVYSGVLAVVCAERGVDYDNADYPMAILATRATVRPEDMPTYDFPFAWVQAIPDGSVDDRGTNSLLSTSAVTCFIADRHQDGEVLAARLQCHLVALVRTFNVFRSPTRDWEGSVTEWTGTPPYAPDELWVGSVGVQIDVRIVEALD